MSERKICDCCHQEYAVANVKIGDKKIALCGNCYANYQYENAFENMFSASFFDNYFTPFSDFFNSYVEEQKTPKYTLRCKCGCTEEDILNTGRFGCSECYKTFKNVVDRYVNELGGKTYAGKAPEHIIKNGVTPPSIEDQIKELEVKLNEAVSSRQYALAGTYDKKIQELKSKINK